MSLASAGTVDTNAGTFLIATGNISGVGSLTKTGAGTLIVTGDATHTGGTTITDGTLQIGRSEEHTSELQSLMRISYAVFCLKKKNTKTHNYDNTIKPINRRKTK